MKTIFLFTLLFSLFASCSNKHTSESNIQEQVTTNINPLEEAFKEIKILKDSCDKILLTDTKVWSVLNDQVYNFIQKDVVKNRIIQEKSRAYFDKLALLGSERITMKVEVKYENGIYKYLIHTHEGIIPISAELTYDSQYDKLTVNWIDNGRIVQSDGEIHYNTEGWTVLYEKDDFGEDIKSSAVAYYNSYGEFTVQIVRLDNGELAGILTINKLTNDNVYLYLIEKFLIKDNLSGKIYNIPFEKSYNEDPHGDRPLDFNGAHVLLGPNNLQQFINLVTTIKDYTIAFKYGKSSAFVKNPQSLKNIQDAILKFL